VPNISYFGNSSASNSAATGINDNIGGPSPVLTLSNQTPITLETGVPIFQTSSATGPFGGFSVSQHFVTAYSMNTNLNVQYQLAKDAVVEVGYSGSLSHHLPDTLDINQIPIGSPESVTSRPYYSQFPNLAAINEVQSVGNAHYNGFLTSFRTTSFHGFTTKLSYTLGHSIDDLSYARGIIPQNSYCLKCDYGNSNYDIRNSFSMFLTYAVPEPRAHRALLGGWQLNTLFSFFTGTPFTVYSGNDSSGTAEFADRAEVVGNPFSGVPASDRATSTYYWFNPAAFAVPTQGTYSNQKFDQFYGPPTHQIDFSVFKNFPITERAKLQFRAEIFNIFNFVNYSGPGNNVSSSSLGLVGSTYDVSFGAPGIGPGAPRNVQLAVKLIF
jgi:hypothetical protein